MEFELSDEQRMIRDAARDFAQKEIAPVAAKFDESGKFPFETIKKMGELGFMGIEVPEEYGGAEMDTLAYVLVMQEIAKVDAAHSTILSVNNSLYNYPLMRFGTAEQKEKFIVPVASGEKTKATLDGNNYIINGRKIWISNAPAANYVILFAMTEPSKGYICGRI